MKPKLAWAGCVAAGLLLARATPALACGVSASGTPGLCDASAAIDEKRAQSRDRIGASYGFTSSILFFSDGFRAPTERHVVMGSWEHPLPRHWTFGADAGALLGGTLASASFRPGFLAAVHLSHMLVAPSGYATPFLLTSFILAGMYASTVEGSVTKDYAAFDFSFGLTAGVPVRAGPNVIFTPFIAGRLFGGPVFWSHGVGTDAYKYSLGRGLAATFFRRVSLSVDGSVLGEKGFRFGVTVSL